MILRAAPPSWTRLIAGAIAIATAVLVVRGVTNPAFLAPDLLAIVLLGGAAVAPAKSGAAPVLLVALAYAAGIFSVSVSLSLIEGALNGRTVVGLAACVLAIIGLVRLGDRA